MGIFLRILLAVYAFFLTIASIIVMLIAFRPEIYTGISDFITDQMLSGGTGRLVLFLIAFIFFLMSLTFLLSGFHSGRDKKSVSRYTNIGEIRISLASIESISLTASRKLAGVKDTKAYVAKSGDGVSILIKAVVMTDINIPSLSEDIQNKVKNSVEESSGVRVADVKVVVDNIYTSYKSRVE